MKSQSLNSVSTVSLNRTRSVLKQSSARFKHYWQNVFSLQVSLGASCKVPMDPPPPTRTHATTCTTLMGILARTHYKAPNQMEVWWGM
mmetsp:Transcript_52729/g.94145  ORF Transcript_52729/g.94145 Transcript_52729/m.94145 type:complete len:88 (+) Transcript_52729:24-287(+)